MVAKDICYKYILHTLLRTKCHCLGNMYKFLHLVRVNVSIVSHIIINAFSLTKYVYLTVSMALI